MAEQLTTVTIPPLAQRLQTAFEAMLERYVKRGITRHEIWLVVARFLFNRDRLCDKDCKDSEIHFHDIDDWSEKSAQDALMRFWRKLQSDKANTYVDELATFARETVDTIRPTLTAQREQTQAFLQTLTSDAESTPFLEFLLEDHKEIEKSFPFQCSVICMLLDMHGMSADERKTTNWVETFFTYFVDDYGNDDTDDDGDDEDSDDDSEDTDDEDEKEPGNTGDNSENEIDESEDGVTPQKKERKQTK